MRDPLDPFHKLNVDNAVIIPMIEDLINQERAVMEANKILKNPSQYLDNDYRISQLQKLLRILAHRSYLSIQREDTILSHFYLQLSDA